MVARHEFSTNLRRPAFLFAAFGVPLLIIVLLAVIMTFAVQMETDVGRVGSVGYVDDAGVLAQALDRPDTFIAFESEDAARAALDAREIGAYFVLPSDYVQTGDVRLYSAVDVPDALEEQINAFLVVNVGAALENPELVELLRAPVDLQIRTLDSGRTLGENAIVALIFIPFIFVFVVVMATQITGGYLMSGVVEEKTNRIMEILVTSITPFQLLLGKVIGLGALGLLQVLAWILIGGLAFTLGQGLDAFQGISIPVDMILIGLLLFLLTYILYASFAAGVGVVIGSEQESRQIASFFVFLMMVPFFLMVSFITDPNGPVPLVLTLIPLTAPVSILLRMGFGSVPAWQLALSLALLALTTVGVVWASARLFRWGLLRYGKRPSLREVLRAIRRAPRISTTAAQ
jgi:ABC-2 type transport system permease protein